MHVSAIIKHRFIRKSDHLEYRTLFPFLVFLNLAKKMMFLFRDSTKDKAHRRRNYSVSKCPCASHFKMVVVMYCHSQLETVNIFSVGAEKKSAPKKQTQRGWLPPIRKKNVIG